MRAIWTKTVMKIALVKGSRASISGGGPSGLRASPESCLCLWDSGGTRAVPHPVCGNRAFGGLGAWSRAEEGREQHPRFGPRVCPSAQGPR